MVEKDNLQRFMFENAPIKGQIAHLNTSYQTIMSQRPYPPMVKHLLGEALVSCMLLAGSIKFEGELSLQFQGDKRLSLILVQCDHLLNLRAYAAFEKDLETQEYADAFLNGKMVFTINQYNQTTAYQSIVPIKTTAMSENLSFYFSQSEQIATQVWLAADEEKAAGMILQLMPGQDSQQREQFWEYAVHIGQTLTENELLNLDNKTLLHRLYHETELRLYTEKKAQFKCRCTEEKMKNVLTVLGKEDVEQLLQEQDKIEVSCDFCSKHYSFDPIDIAVLFHK
ncbi:MAG: Hsp33 family molecular chaperone HslO [Proteobacteria bacterium]|nr:Hsp33 family molecular chaperone HslO [Pseudomonadota bacterium]